MTAQSASPSTEVARTQAVEPQTGTAMTLRASMDYAKALAMSNMLPTQYRGRPENVLWALEYGRTVGLTPMGAITGVHMIEGKPSASAGLMSALVRKAGHILRVTGDARSATCTIIRSDDPDFPTVVTFTLDDAKTAGLLGKQNWRNYPGAMLKARAISQCARDACEEVLFGLHYTPEELGADVGEDGEVLTADRQPARSSVPPVAAAVEVVQDAEVVDEAPPAAAGAPQQLGPEERGAARRSSVALTRQPPAAPATAQVEEDLPSGKTAAEHLLDAVNTGSVARLRAIWKDANGASGALNADVSDDLDPTHAALLDVDTSGTVRLGDILMRIKDFLVLGRGSVAASTVIPATKEG